MRLHLAVLLLPHSKQYLYKKHGLVTYL